MSRAPDGPRLRIAAPSRAGRLGPPPEEWCYLGEDEGLRARAARRIGGGQRVVIGQELARVAGELRRPFLDWIAEIGRGRADPAAWWSLPVSSKSPLQTDLFLHLCQARLVERWLEEGRRRAVIVEDPWLLSFLERTWKGDPRVEFSGGAGVRRDALRCAVRAPLARLAFAVWAFRDLLSARVLFPRRTPAVDGDVVLYSEVDARCFDRPGRFHDPYTGRLEEILKEEGRGVARLAALRVPHGLLRRLRETSPKALPLARFAAFSDVLIAACAPVRAGGPVPPFQGRDASLLFRRELWHEWRHTRHPLTRLAHRAFRRAARFYGGRAAALVYPFENQPWEKSLCAAFREIAPGVRLAGYQHGNVPPLLLNYFLGKGEERLMPLPHHVAANGPAALGLMRESGYPADLLADGGALRYEALFSAARRAPGGAGGGPARIVVAFPITGRETRAFLRDLRELFPAPFLDEERRRPARFLLKLHPYFEGEAGRLPDWFAFSRKPLKDLAGEADALLYTPPTGAWLDVYWTGLPVAKYLDDFLDVDMAEAAGARIPVLTRETLRAGLAALLDAPRGEPAPALESVFSPVRRQVWASLARPIEGGR